MMPASGFGWWRAALGVASGVTKPRADVVESDRLVERQVKRSALAAAARRAAAPIEAGMRESIVLSRTGQAAARWRSLAPASRVRAAGFAIVVAGLTVLVLEAAKPGPAAPLVWIIPVIACALGALVAFASPAFARALGGRNA
jgi:hypothetical protein